MLKKMHSYISIVVLTLLLFEGCKPATTTNSCSSKTSTSNNASKCNDTTPPLLEITNASNFASLFVKDSATVTFNYSDVDSGINLTSKVCYLTQPGGSKVAKVCSDNSFTTNELKDGSNLFEIEIADNAGNKTNKSLTINADSIAPYEINWIKVPAATSSALDAQFEVLAKDANSGIFDYEYQLDNNLAIRPLSGMGGKYTFSSIAAGTHTLKVRAYDQAGNASSFITYTWQQATSVNNSQFSLPPLAPITTPMSSTSYPVPPKSWMIGFNEEFGVQSSIALKEISVPTNTQAQSLSRYKDVIQDLVGNRHVGIFRDIIPISMIAPTKKNDQRYWKDLQNELIMFKNVNARLILSFGVSLPEWMRVGTEWSGWCPIPSNPNDWAILKNNLASTIGEFLVSMANSDPALKSWMTDHLYIDGFNEFDSLGKMSGNNCVANSATAAQAADFSNGITWVINQYGLDLKTLSPSVVLGNPQFLADYYAAGGGGLPNVHIYFPIKTNPSSALQFLKNVVLGYQKVLPTPLKNRIFITETGVGTATPTCPTNSTSGLIESDRNILYKNMVTDSTIKSATEALVFWRLDDLPQGQISGNGCESSYGIIDESGTYKESAYGIFTALQKL